MTEISLILYAEFVKKSCQKGFAPLAIILIASFVIIVSLSIGYTIGIQNAAKNNQNTEPRATINKTRNPSSSESAEIATPSAEKQTIPEIKPLPDITLSAQPKEEAALLSWQFTGSAPQGFKVLKSLNPNPEYPGREGDSNQYLSSPDTRTYLWQNIDATKTYHFRVGIYENGKIIKYSNDVTAKPLIKKVSEPTSETQLTLTAVSQEPGQVRLNWTTKGISAPIGFKTAYSQNPNPTYPQDTWHYLSSPDAREDTFTKLPSGQTLHFRVGVYVGGEKGAYPYSNDIAITVK